MPPSWFVEALSKLASAVYMNTARKRPVAAVEVDGEFGLSLGLAPGESMQVHTAAGYVTVRSQFTPPHPRSPDDTASK